MFNVYSLFVSFSPALLLAIHSPKYRLKNFSTSFRVLQASKSWLKYTTDVIHVEQKCYACCKKDTQVYFYNLVENIQQANKSTIYPTCDVSYWEILNFSQELKFRRQSSYNATTPSRRGRLCVCVGACVLCVCVCVRVCVCVKGRKNERGQAVKYYKIN